MRILLVTLSLVIGFSLGWMFHKPVNGNVLNTSSVQKAFVDGSLRQD